MKDNYIIRVIKKITCFRYKTELTFIRLIKRMTVTPRYQLRGSCKNCGDCCETPMIQTNIIFFRLHPVRRIILAWHRIINGFELIGEDAQNQVFIFRCTHYDPITRRCDSYESRPGICRDYPENIIYDHAFPDFLPGCGYYAVDKKAEKFRASLEKLDLPPEKLETLIQKLHLKE